MAKHFERRKPEFALCQGDAVFPVRYDLESY
jgi:hypothetical protein